MKQIKTPIKNVQINVLQKGKVKKQTLLKGGSFWVIKRLKGKGEKKTLMRNQSETIFLFFQFVNIDGVTVVSYIFKFIVPGGDHTTTLCERSPHPLSFRSQFPASNKEKL